jgi:lipopolysaccharide biosynthesis glycosyltransferase
MKGHQSMIKVFIGYDENETVAFHVLAHSIMRHSSQPVEIVPVVKSQMSSFYKRERAVIESTDFSFTRFLTPYLCGFEGWAIFVDCDMLVTSDIAELWALRDDKYALMCVKHDYQPVGETKFLNQPQTKYEKKNWSSVMMFNNKKCTILTPEIVSTETGLYLHQFKWLENDDLIGGIPNEWNYLVGEEKPVGKTPKLIHYTLGGPYFDTYKDCQYADIWRDELKRLNYATQLKK